LSAAVGQRQFDPYSETSLLQVRGIELAFSFNGGKDSRVNYTFFGFWRLYSSRHWN
jgi:hypothetical protein